MTVLWLNLLLVFIFAFFARYSAVFANGVYFNIKPNKLLVMLTLLTLVLVSGLRINMADTYFYMHSYVITQFSWEGVFGQRDFGFYILQLLLKKYVSTDPQILIFITALLTNFFIVLVLYRYSRMLELSLYVYITGGLYLTSMNGMRQFLAAAIIFIATKYIFDGNWLKYISLVILASTFHQSALVLIPIYFLVRRKAWTKTTLVLLLISVLIVVGYNQFSELLFKAIDNTQYGGYDNFTEGGANILRVIVHSIPVIIAYIGRERLSELYPKGDYIVNLALLGSIFLIISTQNWIFARFNIYFGLYQVILISWVIKLFGKKDQRIIYLGVIVFYLIYFYYECVISFGTVYQSDYINF
ncbi:EpsG family protein [Rossellomorea vietnamensis]|uniref:EpsG family protein n=1 Tax=Rossellomorea vietnamensis TaxID=218284 RepID=A0ACD4C2Y5_9BACI|nr:EpsG family protein [Rossellomorea vietnamensis]UXH42767.1 EpsG family protein [Rossellomorea vietnamensis]